MSDSESDRESTCSPPPPQLQSNTEVERDETCSPPPPSDSSNDSDVSSTADHPYNGPLNMLIFNSPMFIMTAPAIDEPVTSFKA